MKDASNAEENIPSLESIIRQNKQKDSELDTTSEYSDNDDETNDDVDLFPVPDWLEMGEPTKEAKAKKYLEENKGKEVTKEDIKKAFSDMGFEEEQIWDALK